MGAKDDGGPARKKTLRDWFAGQCNLESYGPNQAFEKQYGRKANLGEMAAYIASIKMMEADAMLAERAKGDER